MKKYRTGLFILAFITCIGGGCIEKGSSARIPFISGAALAVLSGSENRELEPILDEFTASTGVKITMTYKGSVDIMTELQTGAPDYDGVWPANSIWISMGDNQHIVTHEKSIMASPVVFGIRKSLAEKLGFSGGAVSVGDILSAIERGDLNFAMTSATQSNSGACAYLGFLSAIAGKNTPITSEDLRDPALREHIRKLLSGVNRSSGSSDWLKELFLSAGPQEDLNAMVNYESLIISANQELVKKGKEPLYVVYPYDGMSLSDSPLAYLDHGDAEKEAAFLALQNFLLSAETQKKLNSLGRRTGITLSVDNPNSGIWNAAWGIDPEKTLSFITLPSRTVILEALTLYQIAWRKPSATVYCLDFSGSMAGDGNTQMLYALETIWNQEKAARYMLQNAPEDYTAVIAFSNEILGVQEVAGNDPQTMAALYEWVSSLPPAGGTDIYSPTVLALRALSQMEDGYIKSVVLMTDGESNAGMSAHAFNQQVEEVNAGIPVFPIMFGSASPEQLDGIAALTLARTFDGRQDIVSAFRQVRGYN
jgi:Ca-activated chloride channel family protein